MTKTKTVKEGNEKQVANADYSLEIFDGERKWKIGTSLWEMQIQKVFSGWECSLKPWSKTGGWGEGERSETQVQSKGQRHGEGLRLAWRRKNTHCLEVFLRQEVSCLYYLSNRFLRITGCLYREWPWAILSAVSFATNSTRPHMQEIWSSQTCCPRGQPNPRYQIPISFSRAFYFIFYLLKVHTYTFIIPIAPLSRISQWSESLVKIGLFHRSLRFPRGLWKIFLVDVLYMKETKVLWYEV